MTHGETICLWCAAPVTLRRGGSPKKFCSDRCRHEFHSCARRWAEAAVAAGTLNIDVLKNSDIEACTLLPRATTPGAADGAHERRSAPVARSADSPHARQRVFEQLMAQAVAMRRR
jgi:hypothetical protein